MKILVINTGSSSVKYELFDMATERAVIKGMIERVQDYAAAFRQIIEHLKDTSGIAAVGHRVVHGGEHFKAPVLIDDAVIEAIRAHIPLAPLHNPANLKGIELARSLFPHAPQVAVFDTAFHQTIPPKAFMYALPLDLYKKHKVRRYGFHGTSHAYVASQAALLLQKPLEELNLITIHLGNGCSMSAIRGGKCVDTSMGMTPLEGLVMGTRSGDIDPAIPFYLADHLNMSLKDIDRVLNKESGLMGFCGDNDFREIIRRQDEANDEVARTALEVYAYRIRKYVGAYLAVLGRCDAIIFTAGIGQNNGFIRGLSLEGMENWGIELDLHKNSLPPGGPRDVSAERSATKVLVIPTNEELMIARAVRALVSSAV